MYNHDKVMDANIKVHTAAADTYNQTEPHFRPENVARIEAIVKSLRDLTNGASLLDIGCGTGFMINIAKNHFKLIRGVDITPAMMEQVDTKHPGCDIKVELSKSESLPYESDTFDVCTAHAVLHHLYDLAPTLKEIHRVLKPGGAFYSDLDPNYYFWDALSSLPTGVEYDAVITREINAVKHKDEELEKTFNIDKDFFNEAEPLKHLEKGFKSEALADMMTRIGFSDIEFHYEWFLGEAKAIHGGNTQEAVDLLRTYLSEMLPLTRSLFKYVRIHARKRA